MTYRKELREGRKPLGTKKREPVPKQHDECVPASSRQVDAILDEALQDTFPASDPVTFGDFR